MLIAKHLVLLFALSLFLAHTAYAQSGAQAEAAGFAGELRRPSNALETDIANRIREQLKRDGQDRDDATVGARFGILGVSSARFADDDVLLLDVAIQRPLGENELPELYDAVADALRNTRAFDASVQPRIVLYIDGMPAYEAVCKNQESIVKDNTRPGVGQDVLVINAAHGVYRHYFRDSRPLWIAQRAMQNGIVEDFLTPVFAERLRDILSAGRIDGTKRIHLIRQALSPNDADSGRAWIDLAGLYALRRTMPGRTDVWGFSCRNPDDIAGDPLREKYYDTSARPRFANAIGADGIINLHTNADCRPLRRGERRAKTDNGCPRGQTVNAAATGMTVFYAPNSPISKTLSDLIVCTSKQILSAHYPDYRIGKPAPRTDLAELFLARKASVVVELGFHTNPSDAALLKTSEFQTLSMQAVSKAWERYVDGERCE